MLFQNRKLKLEFLCATVGLLSDGSSLFSDLKQFFAPDKSPLAVIQARLKPYRFVVDNTGNQDNVVIQLQLRNYGENSIFLTSAKVEFVSSDKLKRGRLPYVHGNCALSSTPNENTPIKIEPGDSIWIKASDGIYMPGLSTWFTKERLEAIYVTTPDRPITLSEHNYIDDINQKFNELYGANATIIVTLYSGKADKFQKFSFNLSEGKDIFAKDGRLQHDWLIANWKYPT